MHSEDATITFGPLSFEVSASCSVSRIQATSYVRSVWRTHLTPTPFTALTMVLLVARAGLSAREERMSWPPVAAE